MSIRGSAVAAVGTPFLCRGESAMPFESGASVAASVAASEAASGANERVGKSWRGQGGLVFLWSCLSLIQAQNASYHTNPFSVQCMVSCGLKQARRPPAAQAVPKDGNFKQPPKARPVLCVCETEAEAEIGREREGVGEP